MDSHWLSPPTFWAPGYTEADSYVLFRGSFQLDIDACLALSHTGASFYRGYFRGEEIFEGPPRYALDFPEYQTDELFFQAGEHQIFIEAHHEGISTRISKATNPFIWCRLSGPNSLVVDIKWKCLQLVSNRKAYCRTNPQSGWMEFRDTRLEPKGWMMAEVDDSAWLKPEYGVSNLPVPVAAEISNLISERILIPVNGHGSLCSVSGSTADQAVSNFFNRELRCDHLNATGFWFRYDLGRVRIGRPSITLDFPAGTVVEIASAEFLTNGRVNPEINSFPERSFNLDRFVLRGGLQTITSFHPRAGRFVEVHVLQVKELGNAGDFNFIQRAYHEPTKGEFSCGEDLLERIWMTGIETYLACSEDALIDNPGRERAQWIGDVPSVSLEISSVAFHDFRLIRRVLIQATRCARDDGLVAAVTPGVSDHITDYASQWVVAVADYLRHTGDHLLLETLWPAAIKNMNALFAHFSNSGIDCNQGSNFGKIKCLLEEGSCDHTGILHFLNGLRAMVKWGGKIGEDCSRYVWMHDQLEATLKRVLQLLKNKELVRCFGYHGLVLACGLDLVDRKGILEFLKDHWRACFPANQNRSSIANPLKPKEGLITPYIAHYLFPLFIENGDMDFVIEQFRDCWGWMLEDGRTTWMEVFDTRWSHCHIRSGCPTWQLTRYALGLFPRYDLGLGVFELKFFPGSLSHAKGRIPFAEKGWIDINWARDGRSVQYFIAVNEPITLLLPNGRFLPVDQCMSFDAGLFCC